jgi:hypothetical protein
MYQYEVKLVIDSEEPYEKEELLKMLEENCLAHTDGAPFDLYFDEDSFEG